MVILAEFDPPSHIADIRTAEEPTRKHYRDKLTNKTKMVKFIIIWNLRTLRTAKKTSFIATNTV